MIKKRRRSFLLALIMMIIMSIPAFASEDSYTVKSGDVLWKIAQHYGLDYKELATFNGIKNPNSISVGQVIKIPVNTDSLYTVSSLQIASRDVIIPVIFTVPKGNKQFPLVVMAHGHGGSKDECGGFTAVAEKLAENGIATIRMDFPGCGDSTEEFVVNSITTTMADVNASLEYALNTGKIDKNKVGILGYSMGGRTATLQIGENDIYKSMGLWAPAAGNGVDCLISYLGGQDVYDAMRVEADQKGYANYTNPWGMVYQLGEEMFDDLENTNPLESIAKYENPILVLHGDKDNIIDPSVGWEVVDAAVNSVSVTRYSVKGGDHGMGIYNDDKTMMNEVVDTTVEFFMDTLVK